MVFERRKGLCMELLLLPLERGREWVREERKEGKLERVLQKSNAYLVLHFVLPLHPLQTLTSNSFPTPFNSFPHH